MKCATFTVLWTYKNIVWAEIYIYVALSTLCSFFSFPFKRSKKVSKKIRNETTYYLVHIFLFILCKKKKRTINNNLIEVEKAVFIFSLLSNYYYFKNTYSFSFSCFMSTFFITKFDDLYESKNCKKLFAFKNTSHEIRSFNENKRKKCLLADKKVFQIFF